MTSNSQATNDSPDSMTLTLMGAGSVGKSALSVQFTKNLWIDEYDPTIEDSYNKRISVDGKLCNITLLDTAGQDEYRAMLDQWIQSGEGFILVYDITRRETLQELEIFVKHIMRTFGDHESHAPIVVVGNKSDMANDHRQVSPSEAEEKIQSIMAQYYRENDYPYNLPPVIETSAKSRKHIDQPFLELVREVRRKRHGKLVKTRKPSTIDRRRGRRRNSSFSKFKDSIVSRSKASSDLTDNDDLDIPETTN
eukprot:gb/GECH01004242.1/.p1 GENE.gb/GECH01004242.1/~~gb/GECH01004242.1/.p1  ORF type:complete len:251 (+),score=57.27 gb/GECH01004242.1/:1-753(+)